MNNLQDYFHTDWSAMTSHDWVGLVMTVVVFLLMVGLYVYVLKPSNREKFEAQRFIPLDDDQFDSDPETHPDMEGK